MSLKLKQNADRIALNPMISKLIKQFKVDFELDFSNEESDNIHSPLCCYAISTTPFCH